ncbi:MAG: hypothetical protein D6733_07505 [Methanobacteriota archaeon]|nr:MAG: hypothetical protein D6733_07505 [Euryarchaeota archaeon]
MMNPGHPCRSCSFYRPLGSKGFCFKHNRTVAASSAGCDDFRLRTDEDLKRRWVFEERDSRRGSPEFEGVTVDEKPVGSEGFALPKKGTVKEKVFIDGEGGEKPLVPPPGTGGSDQGQNLFLAVLLAGLIILAVVLIATGVF